MSSKDITVPEYTIDAGDKIYASGCNSIYQITITDTSTNKKTSAVLKLIEHSRIFGLLASMEVYISRFIHSQFLVHCNIVNLKDGNYQLIMDRARGSVSTLIRRPKKEIPMKFVKRWCWELACGVAKLHSCGILHGDIKGGNVFIYSSVSSDSVENFHLRLADFGLSSLLSTPTSTTHVTLDSKQRIYGFGYTSAYRPPEVWEDGVWSFSADIWALGCTLYEIAYQRLLFPDHSSYKDEKKHCLAIIDEWCRKYTRMAPLPLDVKEPPKVSYKPLGITKRWDRSDMDVFNDLLTRMLVRDPSKRINIWDLVRHPFFEGIGDTKDLPITLQYPTFDFKSSSTEEDLKTASEITEDKTAINLGLYLRKRVLESGNSSSIKTCVIMAHKMLHRVPPSGIKKLDLDAIQDEIQMITALSHQLI